MVGIFPLVTLAGFLPAVEIKGPEILPIPIHHLGMAHIEQAESPPDGADVDRLPKTVQHQNALWHG